MIGHVEVEQTDMPDNIRNFAVNIIEKAVLNPQNQNIERNIALEIREKMNQEFKPQWQCVVGKKYGTSITHEKESLMYALTNDYGILIFRGGL